MAGLFLEEYLNMFHSYLMGKRSYILVQLAKGHFLHSVLIFTLRAVMNKKAGMLAAFRLGLKDSYPALTVAMGAKIVILEILSIRFFEPINR